MSRWNDGSTASSTILSQTISGRLKKGTFFSETPNCHSKSSATTMPSCAAIRPARRRPALPRPVLDDALAGMAAILRFSADASGVERAVVVLHLVDADREARAVDAAAVGEAEGEDMLLAADHGVVAD